jgi:predicted RNA-binding Zn ribbon-like protein
LHFAPDTEADLEFLVALCNTDAGASRSGSDELATPEELTALLTANRYSGRFDRDERELDEVKASRTRLRAIWSMDAESAVAEINRMMAEADALPQLRRHDGLDWHFHATEPDAPLAERIRVEAAMALSDVIRSGELGRLRVCAADDCTGVFVDLSRNGSKRFCSVRCGNRVNMIAFRERAAEA